MSDHFDVIIVGAGLSGIGAACHLRRECPDVSFLLLEARQAIGGTWDLFRYPGVRSDSDMYTLAFDFKPWRGAKAIAEGAAIREYLGETVREHDIEPHIRFGHRALGASWDTSAARWTLDVESAQGRTRLTAGFLHLCGGYYRYDRGYQPDFPGMAEFSGDIVHPQHWPEALDCTDKQVVVIGSGATAMTLAPALVERGARVTIVQRSPTYVVSAPDPDPLTEALRRWLPGTWAHALTRRRNIALQGLFYRWARRRPQRVRKFLQKRVCRQLGMDDTVRHFTPSYAPWDQRLCLVPNADLFRAIRSGALIVVTEQIERFTAAGVRLASGHEVKADTVVTATGLELVSLSGVRLDVDGKAVDPADCFTYKGMMLSGVPNLVQTFGYINASWTLRADLIAHYVCRLLKRMDAKGMRQCTPRLRPEDSDMPALPWVHDFSPGYFLRALDRFPKQGDRPPWINPQDYARERKSIASAPLEDGVLSFDSPLPAPDYANQNRRTSESRSYAMRRSASSVNTGRSGTV
ncbi:MAG: NAD(P)/FAD-dependent oxidoreductase [Gammaproteobacteria bacterium]|nr:NAD(P)/FAD-dependent oxidoreductase [Gammaproteobacteria bacterium]